MSDKRIHRSHPHSQVGRVTLPGTRAISSGQLTIENSNAIINDWRSIDAQELREEIIYTFALHGSTPIFPVHMWRFLSEGRVRIAVTLPGRVEMLDISEAAFRGLSVQSEQEQEQEG